MNTTRQPPKILLKGVEKRFQTAGGSEQVALTTVIIQNLGLRSFAQTILVHTSENPPHAPYCPTPDVCS